MQIHRTPFGKTENNEKFEIFTLINDSDAIVKITNYGGIITDILVPDKNKKLLNIVLGFDNAEDYLSEIYKNSKPYFGAIIGRYGNRINKGRFEIDGKTFQVPCNLGTNALHGGNIGFDQRIWDTETKITKDKASLSLSYSSPHLEEGFPGNLEVAVCYSWNNNNELHIDYKATTDQSTHLNLTNHAYFNLNGCKSDVLDHEVTIYAETFVEVDDNALPTGNFTRVDNSCMDFRKSHKIGEHIADVQGNGYDHNYVVNNFNGELQTVAEAFEPETGIKIEVLSTEPGIQFYTSNWLDGSLHRGDLTFSKRIGFCFETQHFPDSPNQPGFPSTLLKPGTTYHSNTVYKFSNI